MNAERENAWKQKGLLVAPKSERQGKLALDAKRFIEGLRCYHEVRQQLAIGKRSAEVGRFILEERGERPGVTFNSVKKYAQLFRRFCIPPLETLRARIDNKTGDDVAVIRRRFEVLLGKIPEIERLEEVIKLQLERIQEQRKKETELGLPLPGIRLEMELLLQFVEAVIDKKIELGFPGYRRIPQRIDFRGQLLPAPAARLELLTPEDRERLIEFGTTIKQLFEMSKLPGNGRGNC
jgi:hypothetical protein